MGIHDTVKKAFKAMSSKFASFSVEQLFDIKSQLTDELFMRYEYPEDSAEGLQLNKKSTKELLLMDMVITQVLLKKDES